MKSYHLIFYILKIIILILIALISLKIIPVRTNIYIIINCIFKFMLGIFIIYFFISNSKINIDNHDRLLFILAGFILILLTDYIEVINVIIYK